jgi:general secretion pathway protein D
MSTLVKSLLKLSLCGALICSTFFIIPTLEGRTKKGDKLLKAGLKAEQEHDYDGALRNYEEALETDPHEPAYMIPEERLKQKSSDIHLEQGRKLLHDQKLNEAMVQFQKALLINPSSMIALQLISQTNQMLKDKEKLPEGTVILTPAEKARQEVEHRIGLLEGPPSLRPINNQISSLKMNNQPSRVLYESVGKLAGINVLFDPQGIDTAGSTTRNFNLDLTNVTLEEALNYVGLVTHTFWKPISRNAIFVTQESEPKRQEYQDEVVRVFYVQNASSANEFTEIFNGVRTGAQLTTGIFQVASQNAIIARGSPDRMSIVEKLVHDLDRPKAEVMVDVMVMEVSKSKITNLGAALAGQTGGLNIPISYTPRSPISTTTTSGTTSTGTTTTSTGTTSASTTGTSIALSQIGKVSTGDFSLSLPGALVQALLTDSDTRILQRPEVRVTDGGKATLKIGSKIPYVSGSLNSAVATPGSVPYATTQFQQIDVGVNVDLQPHVNGPEDVSMHIKVEISQVTSTETIAGVQQPIISQRVNEADIRMRDGEASLLGGLSTNSDTSSVAGIPGVANMPVLGYLFGTRSKDRERDDIVIALIPHIVRAPTVNLADEGVLAGTERIVKVVRRADTPPPVAATPVLPVLQPSSTPPPATLPPLGRILDLPNGVVPGQTTASVFKPAPNPSATVQPVTQPSSSDAIQIFISPNQSANTMPPPASDASYATAAPQLTAAPGRTPQQLMQQQLLQQIQNLNAQQAAQSGKQPDK